MPSKSRGVAFRRSVFVGSLIWLFLFFCLPSSLKADFSGGSGSKEDPYIITTVEQLQEMKDFLDKHFALGNDIDASETAQWDQGEGFDPIGTDLAAFEGSLDGRGHKISELVIDRFQSFVGLFGALSRTALAENLKLEGGSVAGHKSVGVLAGANAGTITKCSIEGTAVRYPSGATAEPLVSGGLVGENRGAISECYADVSVEGCEYVGGIAGESYGPITKCFVTGEIAGADNVGGIVGDNWSVVSECFSAAEVNADFAIGGIAGQNNGTLLNCSADGEVNAVQFGGGLVGGNLKDIIDCSSKATVYAIIGSGVAVGLNQGYMENCHSVGGKAGGAFYIGGLAGANISELVNCSSAAEVTGSEGSSLMVGVNRGGSIIDCHASGEVKDVEYYSGGLAGANDGTLTRCYAVNDVSGDMAVGGLVGNNIDIISECYATGNVLAYYGLAGGLVGLNAEDEPVTIQGIGWAHGCITASYAAGSVAACETAGGLVGVNEGSISGCFSIGPAVSDAGDAGGLVSINDGYVSDSYWDIDNSGNQESDGGEGRSTAEMTSPYASNTYINWDFDKIWGDDADYIFNDGYPFLLWTAAATPVFEPNGGIFAAKTVSVIVSSGIDGIVIYYTLDGTEPNEDSAVIENGGTVLVQVPCWLKARAWQGGEFVGQTKAAFFGRSVVGDYTGSGAADLAVYQNLSGNWAVLSADGTLREATLGGLGYEPVPADYDGDGKDDVAVFHRETGNWQMLLSAYNYMGGSVKLGSVGFTPVPADYDGDGKDDVAVYEEATGHWFVFSLDTASVLSAAFGDSSCLPIPADYDGDGVADLAVYQEGTGLWLILYSGSLELAFAQFGGIGYIPVPLDFDGDARADIAVYQRATGLWGVLLSGSGYELSTAQLGGPSYIPAM